jgi:hypothetical protein
MCSGDVDGLVSRYPSFPSINQSIKNDAHPSNRGYAVFIRKSYHLEIISITDPTK